MRCIEKDLLDNFKFLEAGVKTSPASYFYIYGIKYYYWFISVVCIAFSVGKFNKKETL